MNNTEYTVHILLIHSKMNVVLLPTGVSQKKQELVGFPKDPVFDFMSLASVIGYCSTASECSILLIEHDEENPLLHEGAGLSAASIVSEPLRVFVSVAVGTLKGLAEVFTWK